MSNYRFTCADGAGETHSYDGTQHRPQDGMPIALKLGALVVEPLTATFGPMVIRAVAEGEGLKGLMESDLLQTLDFDRVGSTIRAMLASVPPQLIYAILQNTNRDGQPLIGNDGRPTLHFDSAYQGNYLEIPKAVWEVCRANAFFPELSTLVSAAKRGLSAVPAMPGNTP